MEQPPIDGKLIAQSYDQWINSEEGSRCCDVEILKEAKDLKYLKNRLWLAFMAGQKSMESNNQ